jgi:hypothetical protein
VSGSKSSTCCMRPPICASRSITKFLAHFIDAVEQGPARLPMRLPQPNL